MKKLAPQEKNQTLNPNLKETLKPTLKSLNHYNP
jgi:hypothetical protein